MGEEAGRRPEEREERSEGGGELGIVKKIKINKLN